MRIAAIGMVLTFGLTALASAQNADQRAACGADAKTLCSGVMPGGGRILDCLAKQKDKLSDACKKVVADQGK